MQLYACLPLYSYWSVYLPIYWSFLLDVYVCFPLFYQAINQGGERIIDSALAGIRAEDATASVEADEIAIKKLVRSFDG